MNKKILHVDDSPLILSMVSTELGKSGYEVISLEKPTQAIDVLTNHDIRVCILDIKMPVLDGLQLLEKIKQFDGGIQVIMLTGEVSQSTLLESHRLGAEACYFKPLESYEPLLISLDDTFKKVERWWNVLQQLQSLPRELN
ncbi:MAG: response regulator [Pirellulales bacterium]